MKYSSWMMKCCSVTNEFTEMQWCETDKTLPIQSFFAHHFAIKLYSIQSIQRFYTMRFFLPKISPILSKVFFFLLDFFRTNFFCVEFGYFQQNEFTFFFPREKNGRFSAHLFVLHLSFHMKLPVLMQWNRKFFNGCVFLFCLSIFINSL